MSWIRLDDTVPYHHKILEAGPSAAWLWVCCIAYAQRHLTDGFVPTNALSHLGVGGRTRPLVDKLVTAGLLQADKEGVSVHHYLDHNESRSEALARRERTRSERAAAGRLGGIRSGKARTGQLDEANPKQTASKAEATVEANAKQTLEAKRSPNPNPNPNPVPQQKAPAARPRTFGRIDLHRWQLDALLAMLGPLAADFELDAWVFNLSARADERKLVLDRKTVWPWVQSELRAECERRGLTVATAAAVPQLSKRTNQILAAVQAIQERGE